jgi:hypothetical protein
MQYVLPFGSSVESLLLQIRASFSMELEPRRMVEIIESRLREGHSAIGVFWYRVLGDRDQYSEQVLRCKGDLPIVPLIVRGERFDNPNSLLADLMRLLDSYREVVEAVLSSTSSMGRPALILLGRTELSMPQVSSPGTLPEWFPGLSGQTVNVIMEDLTFRADGPVASPETRIDDLCEVLFRIEQLMARRVAVMLQSDHATAGGFFEMIRRGDEKLREFLADRESFCSHISNARHFRPSVRDGKSLISRLIGVVGASTPDQVRARGLVLLRAFGLDGTAVSFRESAIALVYRPLTPAAEQALNAGSNMLVTIFFAGQLITAAAHSDSYPRYPLTLLASLSRDVLSVLEKIEQDLMS